MPCCSGQEVHGSRREVYRGKKYCSEGLIKILKDVNLKINLLEDFMKKLLAICIIGLSLGSASVFADHPSGWGIGIVGGASGIGWGSGAGGAFGLSLKAPMLPIYWSLSLGISGDYVGVGITGDYYLFDKPLVPEAKLHWFLGVGGFLGFQHWSYDYNYWGSNRENISWSYFDVGVRVPIGLSWQPFNFLEIFLDIAPSFGIGISTEGSYTYEGQKHVWHKGSIGLGGGLGFEIGLRFWI
jgi:hypothetical protein